MGHIGAFNGSHLNIVLYQCFYFLTLPSSLKNLMRMPFLVLAALGRSNTQVTLLGACCPIRSSSVSDFLQVPLDQRQVAGLLVPGDPREPGCRLLLDQEEVPPCTSVFGCLFLYGHWESTQSWWYSETSESVLFSPHLHWLQGFMKRLIFFMKCVKENVCL